MPKSRQNYCRLSILILSVLHGIIYLLRHGKAVDKSVHVCGAYVSADDAVLIYDQICDDLSFCSRVVGDLVRISGNVLSLIFFQIQSLLFLYFVVGFHNFIEFLRYAQCYLFQGGFATFPTELGQERNTVRVIPDFIVLYFLLLLLYFP